jgi:hypothetical protein
VKSFTSSRYALSGLLLADDDVNGLERMSELLSELFEELLELSTNEQPAVPAASRQMDKETANPRM